MERRRLVPQPRGIVLGLYAGLPDYDYREELDRIAQTGATCVSLQAIYRMETGRSSSAASMTWLKRRAVASRTRGSGEPGLKA